MDSSVRYPSSSMYRITLGRTKSAGDLRRAIDFGFLLVNFAGTNGGTELGIRLDRTRSLLENADFAVGSGTIHLVGTLALSCNEVEVVVEIDLAKLAGFGCLKFIQTHPGSPPASA
jgi:hypothetical protein